MERNNAPQNSCTTRPFRRRRRRPMTINSAALVVWAMALSSIPVSVVHYYGVLADDSTATRSIPTDNDRDVGNNNYFVGGEGDDHVDNSNTSRRQQRQRPSLGEISNLQSSSSLLPIGIDDQHHRRQKSDMHGHSFSNKSNNNNNNDNYHYHYLRTRELGASSPSSSLFPYLPDWNTGTCTNTNALQSWQESQGRPTLKECCEAHFKWSAEACLQKGSGGGDEEEIGDDADNTDSNSEKDNKKDNKDNNASKFKYIPDYGNNKCTNNRSTEPWELGTDTMTECCQKFFQWQIQVCLDESEPKPTKKPTGRPTDKPTVIEDTEEEGDEKGEDGDLQSDVDPSNVDGEEEEDTPIIYPYVPSWGDVTCTNDREPLAYENTYDSLEDCCNEHFEWKLQDCLPTPPPDEEEKDGDSQHPQDDNDDLPTTPPKKWFYPLWSSTKCIVDTQSSPAPDYMRADPETHMFTLFRTCCQVSFSIDALSISTCIENSAAEAPPTRPPIMDNDMNIVDISYEDYFYPDYMKNYCVKNGDEAPLYMKKDPMTFFALSVEDCCDFQFPKRFEECVMSSKKELPQLDVTLMEDEYEDWFYPSFKMEICVIVNNNNDGGVEEEGEEVGSGVPLYMWDDPEGFLAVSIEDCCEMHYMASRMNCIRRSKSYILNGDLSSDAEDDSDTMEQNSSEVDGVDVDLSSPGVIVVFNGRLYFQNVFIPTSSKTHVETIRDVVVNAIKVALRKGYPTVEVIGKTFDGLDLNSLSGRRQRDLTLSISEESSPPTLDSKKEPHSRNLARMQLFTFNATLRVDCDRACTQDVKAGGREVSHDISDLFDSAMRDGDIFNKIKGDMGSMGLVGPFFSASLDEGYLMYESSKIDEERGTWGPTAPPTDLPSLAPSASPSNVPSVSPSSMPSSVPSWEPSVPPTPSPTSPFQFYPKYELQTCLADGKHSEFEINFYDTLEECCDFPWLSKATCLILGAAFTNPPTHAPTTAKPTTLSPTKYPTANPTMNPSTKPTSAPTIGIVVPTAAPTPVPTNTPTKSSVSADTGNADLIEDFELGLSSVFEWSNSGPNEWVVDKTIALSGSQSMRNSVPPKGEVSKLSLSLNSQTGGVIIYGIRHDVYMPWNVLRVERNEDVLKSFAGHSGDPSWTMESVVVSAGENTVSWVVWTSDNNFLPPNVRGTSLVWLDDVRFVPGLSFNFNSGVFDTKYVKFSGVGDWGIDDSQPSNHDGLAAHSPKNLVPGEQSTMTIFYSFSPPGGKIKFDYFLGMGKISFYLNGMSLLEDSKPSTELLSFSRSVAPGQHVFQWVFTAPQFPNLPLSQVWIDNIHVMPLVEGVNIILA